MVLCPKCGFENKTESRFCNECGAVLRDAEGHAKETKKEVIGGSIKVIDAPIDAPLYKAGKGLLSGMIETDGSSKGTTKKEDKAFNSSLSIIALVASFFAIFFCAGITSIIPLLLSIFVYTKVKDIPGKDRNFAVIGMIVSGIGCLVFLFLLFSP